MGRLMRLGASHLGHLEFNLAIVSQDNWLLVRRQLLYGWKSLARSVALPLRPLKGAIITDVD